LVRVAGLEPARP